MALNLLLGYQYVTVEINREVLCAYDDIMEMIEDCYTKPWY
jgi:hypothetical protein